MENEIDLKLAQEFIDRDCGILPIKETSKTKVTYQNELTSDILNKTSLLLSTNEVKEMDEKVKQIVLLLDLKDDTQRAIAYNSARLGYLAAHCERRNFETSDKCVMSVPAIEAYD